MPKARSRKATGEWRLVAVAILSAFVASCTAAGEPNFNLANPSFNGTDSSADTTVASGAEQTSDDGADLVMSNEGTTVLPETVAYVPVVKPGAAFPDVQATRTSSSPPLPRIVRGDATAHPVLRASLSRFS